MGKVVMIGTYERSVFERIRERFERGEDVPVTAVRAAEEVLGEQFVRRGRSARPDYADRAANDTSVLPASAARFEAVVL